MPLPSRLTAYQIERQVIDKALELREPLTYSLATEGRAIAFRQRLYRFRKLAADAGLTQYETFVFRLDGKNVIIEPTPTPGVLFTQDGTIIQLNPVVIKEEFVEEKLLQNVMKDLGLEDEDADT